MAGRNSFGQVTKLPSGRYRARYTIPGAAQQWVNAPSTFDAKIDAEGWLARQRTLIADGKIRPDVVRTTFGTYAAGWLAGRALKESTRVLYRRQLDKALMPTWGMTPLPAITPAAVRAWHSTLLPNRPTERAHVYALLRTILNTAVQDDLINANPCRVRGAGSVRRVKTIRPASLAELEILAKATPPEWRLMVLLGAWCALRYGEVTELRRKDIDLTKGVVRVQRGVTWMTGVPVVDTPKTDAGTRDVAIPPHLTAALKDHLHTYVARGRDALLFPAEPGGTVQLSPHRFRQPFARAKILAGRPDLTFHGLRHTGAVLAAASGATIAELMARLGHTTPAMAMRYQHAAADRDRVIADALSRLVTGGGDG
ncbi:putative prophage phiRv2 integrase [mine drainage metagenome]|uniref:Putative prophage phiRv2 integrase n=1 Tax=mine drainage metagenome TaxID=410659 RepID=A0A1J5QKR7_9ZZZZ